MHEKTVFCTLPPQQVHDGYYRKQQNVADREGGDDVRYEPCPEVTEPDPLDVQNSFLRDHRGKQQQNEQMDDDTRASERSDA